MLFAELSATPGPCKCYESIQVKPLISSSLIWRPIGLNFTKNSCVEHQIDVVNMSLGGDPEINPVVEQSLTAAALRGIACIVAAGNSGDAVKYPASSQHAFAVAALGNLSALQPNTWDSTTVQQSFVGANGMFSPSFSCFGPQISACAQGVSIISTVPGGAYKAESGTSMAAPHITSLVALLLAHHPLFQTQFKARDIQRVAALFNMIRSICTASRV